MVTATATATPTTARTYFDYYYFDFFFGCAAVPYTIPFYFGDWVYCVRFVRSPSFGDNGDAMANQFGNHHAYSINSSLHDATRTHDHFISTSSKKCCIAFSLALSMPFRTCPPTLCSACHCVIIRYLMISTKTSTTKQQNKRKEERDEKKKQTERERDPMQIFDCYAYALSGRSLSHKRTHSRHAECINNKHDGAVKLRHAKFDSARRHCRHSRGTVPFIHSLIHPPLLIRSYAITANTIYHLMLCFAFLWLFSKFSSATILCVCEFVSPFFEPLFGWDAFSPHFTFICMLVHHLFVYLFSFL